MLISFVRCISIIRDWEEQHRASWETKHDDLVGMMNATYTRLLTRTNMDPKMVKVISKNF